MLINALAMSATLPTRRGFSAIRVSCHSKAGGVQTFAIAELKFLSGSAQLPSVTMTSDTSPSPYVVSATNYSPGYEPWHAFNGNMADWWDSGVQGGFPNIQIYFGPGKSIGINGVIMTAKSGLAAPSSFAIDASQDVINWTTLTFVSGITWSDDETKTITW